MSDEEINRSSVLNKGNMQVGDYNQITYYPDNGCSEHENTCLKCSVSNVSLNINNVQDDMVAGKVENRDNHSQVMRSFSQLSNGMDGLYSRLDDMNRRLDRLSRRPNEVEKMITVSPRSDDNAAETMVTSNTLSADNTAVKSVTLSTRSADNAERMFNLNTLSANNAAVRRVTKNDHTYRIDNMDRKLECVNRMIDQMDDSLTDAEEMVRLNSGNDANRMTNMEIRPLDEDARMSDAVSGRLDAIDVGMWQMNARLDNVADHVTLISKTVVAMAADYECPKIKKKRSKWKRFIQLFRRKSEKNNDDDIYANCLDHTENHIDNNSADTDIYDIFLEYHTANHIDNNSADDDIYNIFPEDHTENHIDNSFVDVYAIYSEDHTENHIDNNLVDVDVYASYSEDHTGNHIDNNLVDDDVYAIDSEDHTENQSDDTIGLSELPHNGAFIGCSTSNPERPVIEERYTTLRSHEIGNNDDSYLEINNTSDENGGYISSNEDTVIRPLPDLPPPIASTVENSHLLYDKHTRFQYIYGDSDVLY